MFAGQRQDAPHHACMPQTPAHRSRDQKSTSTQPRWLRSSAPRGRSAFRPNQRRPSLATTPAEALPEATRRGRARRWRPRRGRGAKGSNGEREPCCESQRPKIVRTGLSERHGWQQEVGWGAGWRVFPMVFFLILVLQLLETSTDHFIFNKSEVHFFRCQRF